MDNLDLSIGGHTLSLLVSTKDNENYIALKPLCEALGLEWRRQLKRTQNNPQFQGGVHMYHTPGGPQEMFCIPVCEVGMWLCTINANKVNEGARAKLLSFQRNLQVVIHEHLTGRLTMELVTQLRDQVLHLSGLVDHLFEQNNALQKQVTLLSRNREYSSRVDASCAGKQLAARRYSKSTVN